MDSARRVGALLLLLQPLPCISFVAAWLPVRNIVVKIAASIEQRSRFRAERSAGDTDGIEVGADITAISTSTTSWFLIIDVERTKRFFAEFFLRHVRETQRELGQSNAPSRRRSIVSSAFTQRNSFEELARSGKGFTRRNKYFSSLAAQKAVDDLISVPTVRGAAENGIRRDEESAASANLEAARLLSWVHEQVIGTRRARAFLVRQEVGLNDSLLRALFDARVIHVIKRGVSGGDVPGQRFDVYGLDYGCYVELMSTKVSPTGLLWSEEETELAAAVPANDYRAIRRAILDIDEFTKTVARPASVAHEST